MYYLSIHEQEQSRILSMIANKPGIDSYIHWLNLLLPKMRGAAVHISVGTGTASENPNSLSGVFKF